MSDQTPPKEKSSRLSRLSLRLFPQSGSSGSGSQSGKFEIKRLDLDDGGANNKRNTVSVEQGLVFDAHGQVVAVRSGTAQAAVASSAPSSPTTPVRGSSSRPPGSATASKPQLIRAQTLMVQDRRASAPTAASPNASASAIHSSHLDLRQLAAHNSAAGALSPRGKMTSSIGEIDEPGRPMPRIGSLFQVRMLYDFEAAAENEVTVRAGEICDVAFDVMREQGWFEVVTAKDARGLVPVSFCEVLTPLQVAEDYIGTENDDETTSEYEREVSLFRKGARDSGTISAPTLYLPNEEFDYEDIDSVVRQARAMGGVPPDDDDDDGRSPPRPDDAAPKPQAAPAPAAAVAVSVAASPSSEAAPLSPRTDLLRKRAHVVKEVYETERKYVNDLKFIVHGFRKSLEKSGLLKEADLEAIFRNISSIYELHKVMLNNLEECVAAGLGKGGPFPAANASLASVFVNLSAYLKLYTAYCVPAEHELLTNRGFMSLDAYKARAAVDDALLVAGFDARTGRLVYERGVLREFGHATRSLVELRAADADVHVLVTADHDLYVRDAATASTSFAKVKAASLLDDAAADAVCQLAAAPGGVAGDAGESPLFCELYGVWLACGARHDGRVCFFVDGGELGDWLADTLTRLFGGACVRECDRFVVLDARANELFVRGGGDDDDDDDHVQDGTGAFVATPWLAAWAWTLDRAGARAIVAGVQRGSSGVGAGELPAASARRRDELVRLCLHAGLTAAWRRRTVVYSEASEAQPVARKSRGEVSTREHSGRVWCFTMPSGFVWTRSVARDGDGRVTAASRAVLTGNCTHQEKSRELLLLRIKGSKALDKLLKEIQLSEHAQNWTLEVFLMTPVQRLCKYPLLVRELIKMTAPDHPDYEKLPAAHMVIEKAAEHVNEQKSIDFSIQRMAYIDKNLSGRPAKFQLALPTRRFLIEGELLRIGDGTRQLRRVFLFSDVLIFAKQKGKDKYQFHGMVALVKGQTFVELVSAKIEPNAFQIIKTDNNNIFAATSNAVRQEWLKRLAAILGAENVRMHEPESVRIEAAVAAAPAAGSSPSALSPLASYRTDSPLHESAGSVPVSPSPAAHKPALQRSGSVVAQHVGDASAAAAAGAVEPAQRGQSSLGLRYDPSVPAVESNGASRFHPQMTFVDDDIDADDGAPPPPPPPPLDDDEEDALIALSAMANQ